MLQLTVLNNVHTAPPSTVPPGDAALEQSLRDLLPPPNQVRFSKHDRLLYATDASLYQVEPLGVVVPASTDDAARLVAFAGRRKIPLLPRGGGTSLAGQCTNRAVVLDLTGACRAVRDINPDARTVYAEAGVGIDELNDHLTKHPLGRGLFFAPDPATTRQCAIGGAIGNNAAGARSVMYGRTSENLVSIDAALVTGERLTFAPGAGATDPTARRLAQGVIDIVTAHRALIRQRFPRTIRRNAGYALDMILDQIDAGATADTLDLSKLLCGSEGTLAVTLGATLALRPTPKAKGLAVVAFDSVEDAINAVPAILETNPSAVELLDDVVLEAARGNAECRRYLELCPKVAGVDPNALHYVEYFAFSGQQELDDRFAALRRAVGAAPAVAYTDAPSMNKLWLLRKAGEPLLHGLGGNRKPITFVEDNAVPVERLGEFVRRFKEIVARHGTKAAYWAHASVGVLHVRPMIDLHDPDDRERMKAIAVEVADLARDCGGIMSGEHGDGRVRGPLLERFFGSELIAAFRQVKALFDPHHLLNPGNIVAAGPIDSIAQSLRIDYQNGPNIADLTHDQPPTPSPAAPPPAPAPDLSPLTYFNYADAHGFGHAVEQCNGAGVCRKRSGTMCPSYHATLDERHSTRGRGNALRLAITGQFNPAAGFNAAQPNWADPGTIETLDLCLSCKACKSECPSNVDIARLKAEYTAQRYRTTRIPLHALATGYVRVLNRAGAIAPDLANWFNSTRPARALINRAMHIHPRRSLPRFTKPLFRRRNEWTSAASPASPTSPSSPSSLRVQSPPRVLLFADCFTTYNESDIGVSAARLLARLGYHIDLPDAGCCARSMISVGMLAQAIDTIDATVERLAPAITDPSVKAILVVEPSCLSAITDDWLNLKCRSPLPLRQALAAKAMLVEDFVDRFWDQHPTPPRLTSDLPAQVLLHAHCHQKALWGAETSARLLRRLLGDRLKVLDTGCCGMAGSFGYAEHRFDVSNKIAELALLPAVRAAQAAKPDTIVTAPGTSCRHQLHDAAHVRALHPIELAERLITA